MSDTESNKQPALSPVKQALLAMREMKARIDKLEKEKNATVNREPLAIVGMACRLPGGSNTPEQFWENLREGRDCITEVPADRWNAADMYDADLSKPGKANSRWGGFIDQVDQFDPLFFGITPREAESMDPQQRLLMEVAWEALENSGIVPESLNKSMTGVYIGMLQSDYTFATMSDPSRIDIYTATGATNCIIPNRLSYFMNWNGPSLCIDTACSGSLVAIHVAAQALRNHECDVALAGGVSLMISPAWYLSIAKLQAMSPDGRCKTFDSRGNGYVRGEGCGIIVLKRLSDALAAGDEILALIRGSAVNQDGRTNGLTAPSARTQEACLRLAARNADVQPSRIGLIEAHGTGTQVGDPIEYEAAKAVYDSSDPDAPECILGSAKANIGHLEPCAGVAGVIKAVLSIQHGKVPPLVHFKELNNKIEDGVIKNGRLGDTRFRIPNKLIDWPANHESKMAGVSSFGIGGANAHVILEEGPGKPASREADVPERPSEDTPLLLTLSAKSPEAARALAGKYENFIRDGADLYDASCAAALRRTHLDHRLAVVADTRENLLERLNAFSKGEERPLMYYGGKLPDDGRRLVFVFPGQGSQWWAMGRELLDQEPIFRETLEKIGDLLKGYIDWSLMEELTRDEESSQLDAGNIEITQIALFGIQVALFELWKSYGIIPDAVVGHSMGEVASAYAAGALSLEDAVRVIFQRSNLLQSATGQGAMCSVDMSMEEATKLLKGKEDVLSIAGNNGPSSCTLSGDAKALEEVMAELERREIFHKKLRTTGVAGHSPQLEPIRPELVEKLAPIKPRDGEIEFYSTVTASRLEGSDLTPEYWGRNLREPVLFAPAIEAILEDEDANFDTFVEIGAHPVLSGFISQCVRGKGRTGNILPSLRRKEKELPVFLGSVGALHALGISPDWNRLFPAPGKHIRLPNYTWNRQRYWMEGASFIPSAGGAPAGGEAAVPLYQEALYDLQWRRAPVAGANGEGGAGDVWLLFADESGTAESVAEQLRAQGRRPVLIRRGDQFENKDADNYIVNPADGDDYSRLIREVFAEESSPPACAGILHLWSLDAPASDGLSAGALDKAQVLGPESTLHLVRAVVPAEFKRTPRIWLITRGAQHVVDGDDVSVAQGAFWGFGRTVAKEQPDNFGGMIDLAPVTEGDGEAALILEQVLANDGEEQIAFRGKERYAARLAYLKAENTSRPLALAEDAAYIVTGGMAGIGARIAGWLADRGAKHLILVARTDLPPREEWDGDHPDSLKSRIQVVKDLEAKGVTVRTAAVDLAGEDSLRSLVEELRNDGTPPIKGVAHVAGLLTGGSLLELTVEDLYHVMRPKLIGGWVLHDIFKDDNLDFFILFSSLSALLVGLGEGMANYSAANAFLDGLAQYRVAKGLPATAVNWGGWKEAGYGSSEQGERLLESLAQRGIGSFTPEEGIEALERMVMDGRPQAAFTPMDWSRFQVHYQAASRSPMYSEVLREEEARIKQKEEAAARQAAGAQSADESEDDGIEAGLTRNDLIIVDDDELREELLIEYLTLRVSQIMRMPAHSIDTSRSLKDLGLDSLTGVEVKNVVETELGFVLPVARLLDGSNILQLTRQFIQKLGSEIQTASSQGTEQPMSAGQRALWYLDNMSPRDASYQVHMAVRVPLRLDPKRLKPILQYLIERHAPLRAVFRSEDGIPSQVIQEGVEVDYEHGESSIWTEEEFLAILTEEENLPFDLEKGPLLRIRSHGRSDEETVVQVTAHQIIADARGLRRLLREMRILYIADEGKTMDEILEPMESDFFDYVRGEEERLQGSEGEKLRAFWEKNLAGDLAVLDLPADSRRGPLPENHAAHRSLKLEKSRVEALRAAAKAADCSVMEYLLAVYQVFLHRYTNQDDIVVGAPRAPMIERAYSNVVGPFADPVVLRANFQGVGSFKDFLKTTREAVRDANENGDYPFLNLVEQLRPRRYPGRPPIFQSLFETRGEDLFDAGKNAEVRDLDEISIEHDFSPYDIALTVITEGGGIMLDFKYRSSIFAPETMERMSAHFDVVLKAALEHPQADVDELELLTREDDPGVEHHEDQAMAWPVHVTFEDKAEDIGGLTAILRDNRYITYQELNTSANRIAGYLAAQGLKPGTRVLVCMGPSPDFIFALLGVMKAGGVCVPAEPAIAPGDEEYSSRMVANIARDSAAGFIITEKALADKFSGLQAEIIVVDGDKNPFEDQPAAFASVDVGIDASAVVIYSGFDRETPLGSELTHGALARSIMNRVRKSELSYGSRTLQLSSPASPVFVDEIFSALSAGGMLVLVDKREMPEEELIALLTQKAIERVFVSDVVLRGISEVAEDQDQVPHYLRELIVIGERVQYTEATSVLLKKMRGCVISYEHIFAETGVAAEYVIENQMDVPYEILPMGKPVAGRELFVLDRRHQMAPIGVPGEICIGGPELTSGYAGSAEKTAENFITIPSPSGGGERKIFRTGRVGKRLQDGNIQVLGALENRADVRGFPLNLEEIEYALEQHGAIRHAIVVPREELGGNGLLAYIASNRIVDRLTMLIRCEVEYGEQKNVSLITDDISPTGVSLIGVPEDWEKGMDVQVKLMLQGGVTNEVKMEGTVMWVRGTRGGILFKTNPVTQSILKMGLAHIIEMEALTLSHESADFRVPLKRACIVDMPDGRTIAAITDSLSLTDVTLVGMPEDVPLERRMRVSFSLPDSADEIRLNGTLKWRDGAVAGLVLNLLEEQKDLLKKFFADFTKNQLLSVAQLRSFLREDMPHYLIPQRFIILDEVPKLADNTVHLSKLPYSSESMEGMGGTHVAPRTPVEGLLEGIWTDTLGVDKISIHDNFFEVGGTSLLAMVVLAKIEDEFQVQISIRSFILAPTILDTAAMVIQLKTEQEEHESMARAMEELEQLSAEALREIIRSEEQFT